jgi:hypothetical protein
MLGATHCQYANGSTSPQERRDRLHAEPDAGRAAPRKLALDFVGRTMNVDRPAISQGAADDRTSRWLPVADPDGVRVGDDDEVIAIGLRSERPIGCAQAPEALDEFAERLIHGHGRRRDDAKHLADRRLSL